MIKKGEKSKWFCFLEKSEIDYKKKENFFYSFRELFNFFLVVSLPEKMIRKFFGVKEKE